MTASWWACLAWFGVGGAFLIVWCGGCAHGYTRGERDGIRAERRRQDRQRILLVRRTGREAWARHHTADLAARAAARQDQADLAAGRGWTPKDAA